MPTEIVPFLMFEGRAEEALEFYISVLPQGRVLSLERFRPGEEGREGTVKQALFEIAGQKVRCYDSHISHGFGFTPAFSFFITCDEAGEVDRLAAALGAEGRALMPAGDYGFSARFAWVEDRFGVSWQVNCA